MCLLDRWTRVVTTLLDILDRGDACPLVWVIVILLGVGSQVSDAAQQRGGAGLAAAAFVAYCVRGCVAATPARADDLLRLSLRGVLAAGLTLGAAWILMPPAAFAYRRVIVDGWHGIRDWAARRRQLAAERRARSQEEERRSREREAYEQSAPERERARREAEEQALRAVRAQKRRADARARCELLFALYAPDLAGRFSRAQLDAFIARYMGDGHPPEEVEERAGQLEDILRRHYEKATGAEEFRSIEELAAWYTEQKRRLEALPLDGRFRQTLLANLRTRYAELVEEVLARMRP